MAITYPRAQPAPIALVRFEPDYQTTHAPEQGGELNAIVLGPARWRADFSTPPMRGKTLSAWRAWLRSMENGVGTFYARDPTQLLPQAYPQGFGGLTRHGGGAFDGAATSWSVDATGKVLTVNGLPSTFNVTEGDLASFSWDTSKRYLTSALETVSASAGVAVFEVSPRIESFVDAGAVLTFLNPECVMRVVPGSIQIDNKPGPIGQAHFRALQALEA